MFLDKLASSLLTCCFYVHHYWMDVIGEVHEGPRTGHQPATNLEVEIITNILVRH